MTEIEKQESGKTNENNAPSEEQNDKKVLASGVSGCVKWYNVSLGYGFIGRNDGEPDVFVHHTSIAKYNVKHQISSLADKEVVQFDVVEGTKGPEAINVTGPNGEQVRGSRFASNLYAGAYRSRFIGQRGGDGGRRYYDNKRNRRNHKLEVNGDQRSEEKPMIENKENAPPKKDMKKRAPIGVDGGKRIFGRLKRSCSLPTDLDRYIRRELKGPRRHAYNLLKQRGQPKEKAESKPDGNSESKVQKSEIEEKLHSNVESGKSDRKVKSEGKKAIGKNRRQQKKTAGGDGSGRDTTEQSKTETSEKDTEGRSSGNEEGKPGRRRKGYRRRGGSRKNSTNDAGGNGDAKKVPNQE